MEPMLATPVTPAGMLPRGPEWAFEVKWDGVRVLADTTGGRLRLWSRRGNEVTVAYPELGGIAAVPDAVLDGEVVVLVDGVPRFSGIAERMHVRDARRARELAVAVPATFVVFDALRLSGVDLTGRTYDERRAALAVVELGEHALLSTTFDDGAALWAATREHGLEGVVAKRRASTYHQGRRSADWVKAAHHATRTAFVGGWREETSGSGRLGALLLGSRDVDGRLRYLGRAGSGLSAALAAQFAAALAPLEVAGGPFADDVPTADARGARWCVPTIVADVRYLARTPQGRLRQPVVRALRTDADPEPWEQA